MAQGNICPGLDELMQSLLALLPRGRAWGDNHADTSPIYRFWRSVAACFYDWELLACALIEEFFPSTARATLDLWYADYGLPDGCDPYPNLVAKVRAAGGSTCSYFQAVAAAAGWSIACMADQTQSAGLASAGCSQVGQGIPACTLLIRVYLSQSRAYNAASTQLAAIAGSNWTVGGTLGCGPDLTPLFCLMARMIPAHLAVIYEVVP
ncbi:uncharacterized protein YmfQ (DUF2313 family) [Agrobacterium vitis]|nr:uncharacterized protein YmfQ (DUF2313 family) [Agrobacterium vitis]